MPGEQKVFYLGFHKTGTTSFGALMRHLGFKSRSVYKPYSREFVRALREGDYRELFEVADQFTAFDDDPWCLFYREFEQRYPQAKFVFYERDPEKWYQSSLLFFGRSTTPMAELIFGEGKGSPMFNREHQIARYREHSREVREYFRDKPDKLLEIHDLSDRSADEVAGFLGFEEQGLAFPRENVNRLDGLEVTKRRAKVRIARILGMRERYVAED